MAILDHGNHVVIGPDLTGQLVVQDVGGCKNFCVNVYLEENCRAPRSEDDRSKESCTERIAGQPAG